MAMAMAIGRRLLAAGRLPPPTSTPVLPRRCSKATTPTTPPTVAEAISQAVEDFSSFLKTQKPDIAKVAQFAEEISKALKDGPPEVGLAKARGLVAEMSKVLNVSTFETRLTQAEVAFKAYRKINFGVGTLFAATLMTIPATVYIAKLDSDNEITTLKSRVSALEADGDQNTPKTVNLEARVSHEFKVESEANSPKNQ